MNQAGAMHGDRVETTIIALKSGGRREGRVTAVLERAHVGAEVADVEAPEDGPLELRPAL
ncbi:MAG: hypothetical protein CL437_08360 [Acidimicrobiaceae bacterium]|nr:hypothetical protein [Acidimicrobiaceae bacterium]